MFHDCRWWSPKRFGLRNIVGAMMMLLVFWACRPSNGTYWVLGPLTHHHGRMVEYVIFWVVLLDGDVGKRSASSRFEVFDGSFSIIDLFLLAGFNKYSCGGANQSASQKSEPQGWTPRYATLSLQVEPVQWDLFSPLEIVHA
jgi:hypothetical protein